MTKQPQQFHCQIKNIIRSVMVDIFGLAVSAKDIQDEFAA
jgi:hypothetical protein